jgi:hypothetical protein
MSMSVGEKANGANTRGERTTMAEGAVDRGGNGWRIARWGTAAVLLTIPLVMMRISDEWNWTAFDFVIIGAFMAGGLLAYEMAVRTSSATAYRAGAGIACVASFVLLWVNGAVGIIGSENNDANLLYFGVVVVGILGAILARFRPNGMALALFAMAITQFLVVVIALAAGWVPPGTVARVAILNGFFVTLFVGSALLFRHAALDNPARGAVA